MSKEMIISVNGREKKIAILDNGRVSEFYIERGEENTGIAGNIYKGRVQRVLPGMQSAFVSIGLERDAFLYVSDFFDEEEEIERIVMEKSRKASPEEAKREANEQIERARIEREKQMDAAQEIAEPLVVAGAVEVADAETSPEKAAARKGRGRRGARDKTAASEAEEGIKVGTVAEQAALDESGFERVVDDEDTGELFKDAYLQEAIFDKVRAVEFEMESTEEAAVGSLLGTLAESPSPFERIADEDETASEPRGKKGARSRAGKSSRSATAADANAEGTTSAKPKRTRAAAPKAKSPKTASARTRAKKKTGPAEIEDAAASVRESPSIADMSVRRGGRGRRRGGRGKKTETAESRSDLVGFEDIDLAPAVEDPNGAGGAPETMENVEGRSPMGNESVDIPATDEKNGDKGRGGRENRGDRNGRGRRRGRDDKRQDRGDRYERRPQPTISDLLREGQEILVQIAKEPIAKKGARITSHIALPGRFLVYMPTIEHLGVSRKIESSSERGRLRTLIQRIRQEEEIPSGGFIVRTAGIGISEEDLRQDARYLVRTWLDIKKRTERSKSPALVHQDLDIVQRLLRDQLSDDFTAIRVDSEEEYLRTVEFINRIQPRMVNRVKLYTREQPILEAYGVQEEIDKALKPRVWLKSGGYLVINQTEALVAIDVNTGKFVGKGNARLEDTITRTNMEAVDEIARQIRLRDLGGIIVLDLIDMEDRRNRHKVSQALQEALSSDKSPTKVLSFNDFGLIIMTRKRVKQSLERTMCAPCDYCEGAGWVKSPQTVCYEILAEARRLSKELEDVRQTTLRLHPEVAKALRNSERQVLEEIEAYLGNIDITSDPSIHQAQFDFAFV